MPPSPRTIPSRPDHRVKGTIHIVRGGKTRCGVLTPDLYSGETWHEWNSPMVGQANCQVCEERKR